jgi:hypothetical protein
MQMGNRMRKDIRIPNPNGCHAFGFRQDGFSFSPRDRGDQTDRQLVELVSEQALRAELFRLSGC